MSEHEPLADAVEAAADQIEGDSPDLFHDMCFDTYHCGQCGKVLADHQQWVATLRLAAAALRAALPGGAASGREDEAIEAIKALVRLSPRPGRPGNRQPTGGVRE